VRTRKKTAHGRAKRGKPKNVESVLAGARTVKATLGSSRGSDGGKAPEARRCQPKVKKGRGKKTRREGGGKGGIGKPAIMGLEVNVR